MLDLLIREVKGLHSKFEVERIHGSILVILCSSIIQGIYIDDICTIMFVSDCTIWLVEKGGSLFCLCHAFTIFSYSFRVLQISKTESKSVMCI